MTAEKLTKDYHYSFMLHLHPRMVLTILYIIYYP